MPSRKRASLDDLARSKPGVWHELPEGLQVEWAAPQPPRRASRVRIVLRPEDARKLRTRPGEVIEPVLRGETLELTRRKRRPLRD